MQFPGLDMPPDVSIARFVDDTQDGARRHRRHARGLDLRDLGRRPEPTAQDVGLLAPLVDYISPMVYPALWNSGEYGVRTPSASRRRS